MKLKSQILSLSLLLTVGYLQAQSNGKIKSFGIGAKVPEKYLSLIPVQSNTRLIILDFWAISCTPCLRAFPKMDSLQKRFGETIRILLITKNTKEQVDWLYNRPFMKGKQFPGLLSITQDTLWSRLFPHEVIPHHVWIDRNGIVKAITNGYNTNANNINSFLKRNSISLPEKTEIPDVYNEKPLFSNNNLPIDKLIHHSIFIKGKVQLTTSTGVKNSIGGKNIQRKAMIDEPILNIYRVAAAGLIPDFNEKRMLLDITDTSKILFNESNLEDDDWMEQNLYTYELIIPSSEDNRLYNYMLDDLNKYSGYLGKIEKKKTKCWILIRTSQVDKLKTKGGETETRLSDKVYPHLINAPMSHLIGHVLSINSLKLPVINETNYEGNIDIEIHADFNDLNVLRKELQKYDLDLIEEERELNMFLLTEKKHK